MCGIVGHLGPQDSIAIVLDGLKKLEYRGYDSAGISFNDKNTQIQTIKKEGKLDNLLQEIGDLEKYNALSCIGHTRWATHGGVNDTNAHPHQYQKVSLVHNGIIENATVLRNELRESGYKFKSETDSEVFLMLIVSELEKGNEIFEAIVESFKRIDGNSAFVILDEDSSDLYAVKKGAPLVCGIHAVDSSALVSSDPYALIGKADKIYFPEDEVICHLSTGNEGLLKFLEFDKSKSSRYMSKKQEMSLEVSSKGGFEHFMLKEIHEQPGLIRGLTQYYFEGEGKTSLEKVSQIAPERFLVSACGTAGYAGLAIKDYLERFNKIPTSVDLASEFRYRNPLIRKGDTGLFVSQSGETADTLAAQSLCKERGIPTFSIVNVEGSTLYRDCDANLLIRAGIEIGVASTKAFTQQALTGRLLSFALGPNNLSDGSKKKEMIEKFNLLATRMDELLHRADEIKNIAESIYDLKGFFYTGRGIYFPMALEGALKLKEIAYVHAEGYASGELKHGPIALIDEKMVNIAIVGKELYEKTVSNIEEIKSRRGVIVTLGPEGDKELENISDYYFGLNFDGLDELAPLYVNMANQLLAYYMAKFKGTDIDRPRNLAKSVTVE